MNAKGWKGRNGGGSVRKLWKLMALHQLAPSRRTICRRVSSLSLASKPIVKSLRTRTLDLSIEAPPSVLPQRRYCDITGLEVRESCALRDLLVTAYSAGTIHRSDNGATISRQEHLRTYQRLGECTHLRSLLNALTKPYLT